MPFNLGFLPTRPLQINAMLVFGVLILVCLVGGYMAAKTLSAVILRAITTLAPPFLLKAFYARYGKQLSG